ncbi:UDP-glucose 4-epimerase GalE [Herminiimonas fonticola]|uniref:UDP-glucose 4-epimerase n=1 Tax=Herminiimonas fonticola TaxID=303380 RepID=A0A4R6G6J8_9BURK|nr:UDP-glucose 4-epimerase GalE [Herminiimonas fonticola]RBA22998.1 galE: UDP-glucose 4-epimerase GalE [Herminiimonas fonticola]TDN89560.1 UDP-glucose 4-epimerase [Herminiimonas fonticola]
MKILVTGGAGYIGSHTCVELINAGYQVVVVDNLCNSKASVLERVAAITGATIPFIQADLRNRKSIEKIFEQYNFDAVMHFAGLKAVGESVMEPLRYYDNNVEGSLVLFQVMAKHYVTNLVFSSSATVYGDPATVPILEDFPLAATNPYGRSKLMIEEMLRDLANSDPEWHIALLRYFNPAGAHESGLIGEDPNDIPNNLFPYVAQVASGRRDLLSVYGDDYPTDDGTGVRDYIHVVDLAIGHVKTLEKLLASADGVQAYNLGTGCGSSVLQMIKAFERASGRAVPYRVVARRPGDVAVCYADASLAQRELGWHAHRTIEQMCIDTWRWQSMAEERFAYV